MSTTKPLSDLSVHLQSWGAMALQANLLRPDMDFGRKMNRVLNDCHIYLLCRRPLFSFNPDTFDWSSNRVSGDLLYREKGELKSLPFGFDLMLTGSESTVELGPAPYRDMWVLDDRGERTRTMTAQGTNNLEVLYVGHVFEEGKTSVFDRICRKESLMTLVAEMQQALPDDEIIIFVFEYLPYKLLAMPGNMRHQSKEEGPGKSRFVSINEKKLTEHQKICLVKGGLVCYFRPEWQSRGEEIVPGTSRDVLDSCEELDMAGLILEITSERSHLIIYSASSAVIPHHMTTVNLTDPAERASFFAISM